MPPDKDQVRISHMREAATRAVTFSAGRSRADLDHDDMLVLADDVRRRQHRPRPHPGTPSPAPSSPARVTMISAT
ncbi:MAG: hypothetical protein ACRDTT_25545 [Pseudonocardiaceae bacterium]